MARNRFKISTEAKRALDTASQKPVILLTSPTSINVAILGLSFTMDGVTAGNTPVEWLLINAATAGTGGTALTEQVMDGDRGTPQSTGLRATWTTDPATSGVALKIGLIHPMTGFERVYGPDEEIIMDVNSSIMITAQAAQAVNANVELYAEE